MNNNVKLKDYEQINRDLTKEIEVLKNKSYETTEELLEVLFKNLNQRIEIMDLKKELTSSIRKSKRNTLYLKIAITIIVTIVLLIILLGLGSS